MASGNLTEKAMRLLDEKSAKARLQAKQVILEEKTGFKKIDIAIEQYLSKWNDTTRPGVLALAYEAVGGNPENVVPLQSALLFIDATMDIHDDIIDESVAKKNRKTVYGKIGKEAALLIGDAFMVKGFIQLHKLLENIPKDRAEKILDIVKNFLLEVVDAHIAEAELKDKKWKIKPEVYLQILTRKAADIEGRMRIGAILGGGSLEEIDALGVYGRNLGVLVAVKSDFVDVFEPEEMMHRIKYECLPLHMLYALSDERKGKKIREILLKEKLVDEDCFDIAECVRSTEEVAFLNQHLKNLEREAVEKLSIITDGQIKSQLRLLAASVLEDL